MSKEEGDLFVAFMFVVVWPLATLIMSLWPFEKCDNSVSYTRRIAGHSFYSYYHVDGHFQIENLRFTEAELRLDRVGCFFRTLDQEGPISQVEFFDATTHYLNDRTRERAGDEFWFLK